MKSLSKRFTNKISLESKSKSNKGMEEEMVIEKLPFEEKGKSSSKMELVEEAVV